MTHRSFGPSSTTTALSCYSRDSYFQIFYCKFCSIPGCIQGKKNKLKKNASTNQKYLVQKTLVPHNMLNTLCFTLHLFNKLLFATFFKSCLRSALLILLLTPGIFFLTYVLDTSPSVKQPFLCSSICFFVNL